MGKEVKIDVGYKDVLEKSLSAIQYLRVIIYQFTPPYQ